MSIYRKGEQGSAQERSPRFVKKDNGDWYFYTREGMELGPYDSCIEAQRGLKDYLEFISCATPEILEKFYASNAA